MVRIPASIKISMLLPPMATTAGLIAIVMHNVPVGNAAWSWISSKQMAIVPGRPLGTHRSMVVQFAMEVDVNTKVVLQIDSMCMWISPVTGG